MCHKLNLNIEQIVKQLVQYQQIDSEDPKLMLQIGIHLLDSLRNSQAEEWFIKTIQLAPKNSQNYHQITEALKKHRRFHLLVQFAEKWNNNLGTSSEQLVKIGKLYDSIKECERAATIFLNLLQLYPQQKQYYLLYLSNQRLKYIPDTKKAFQIIQKAKLIFPQHSEFLQQQAFFYHITLDTDLAIDIIINCITKYGSVSKQAHHLLIRSLINTFQCQLANQYALMYAQMNKQQLLSLWLIAKTEFFLGNFKKFKNISDNILQICGQKGYSDPNDILAIIPIYYYRNEKQKIYELIQLYRSLAPEEFMRNKYTIQISQLYYQKCDNKQRTEQSLKLLIKRPTSQTYYKLKLCKFYLLNGKRQQSLQILQQFIQTKIYFNILQKKLYLELLMLLNFEKESIQYYQSNLIYCDQKELQFNTKMNCFQIVIVCLIKHDQIEQAFSLFIKYQSECRKHTRIQIIILETQIFITLLRFCIFFGQLGTFEHYRIIIKNIFDQIPQPYLIDMRKSFRDLEENYEKQQTILSINNDKFMKFPQNYKNITLFIDHYADTLLTCLVTWK